MVNQVCLLTAKGKYFIVNQIKINFSSVSESKKSKVNRGKQEEARYQTVDIDVNEKNRLTRRMESEEIEGSEMEVASRVTSTNR